MPGSPGTEGLQSKQGNEGKSHDMAVGYTIQPLNSTEKDTLT